MNVTSLPTTTFNISQTYAEAYRLNGSVGATPIQEDLGSNSDYLLLMWLPIATFTYGSGGPNNIPTSDKLGGLVMKQVVSQDLDYADNNLNLFTNAYYARTMMETYGSDMTGFC